MELTSSPPTVVVKVANAGPLTLRGSESGPFGAFWIQLLAVPQGFSPTTYLWDVDEGSPDEQQATGQEANFTLSIGSKGEFLYDHQARLTASDESGKTATARYAIHVDPPAGRMVPRYGDPASRIGAKKGDEDSGHQLLGYETVLVEAETEGLLGHKTSVWKIAGGTPMVSQDSSGHVVHMLVTGDANNIDSYEGVSVEVQITDEIDQSIVIRRFIEAVIDARTLTTAT